LNKSDNLNSKANNGCHLNPGNSLGHRISSCCY
jgi:hypothetical protein